MKKILASVLVSAFPLMAFAQNYTPSQGVFGLMAMLKSLLNYSKKSIRACSARYW